MQRTIQLKQYWRSILTKQETFKVFETLKVFEKIGINFILRKMNTKLHNLIRFLTCILFTSMVIVGCKGPTIHEALATGDQKALIKAINDGSDVNEINKDGLSPLHITVKKCDTTSTRLLLEHGANVEVADKDGKTVVQTAYFSAFGTSLLSTLDLIKKQSVNEPSVRNLGQIMNVVRGKTGKSVNVKGNLSVGMEMTGFTSEGAMQMVSHVNLSTDGRSYELILSLYETKYINVDKSVSGSGGNVVLRPGSEYRMSGIEDKGKVSVTLLESLEPSKGKDQMTIQISEWLPDTWAIVMALPWIKELNSKQK